ncbi:MAG: aminodeoxychorismate synthase component I [Magnetovibrio sp.]|nr:aminodeoxychorismate synthase component I [Magnetovibrio sp.]
MQTQAPFVLIDDARSPGGAQLFSTPHKILSCTDAKDVPHVLRQIEEALSDGHHVAGYMAYELGYLLEPKLATLLPPKHSGPLIWMGVFSAPSPVDDSLFDAWAEQPHDVGEMRPTLDRETYITQVEKIREHIRAGDGYQINHTFKQHFDFSGSALSLYAHLRRKQRARYGALIADGTRHILSLSPELFVATQNGVAHTRPMKGTAARAANPADDERQSHWLCHDEKSKAENLMIVDLLRNDLGRIALVGSVNVTDLFTVETYPTLHQLTSGIEAKLRPGTGFCDMVQALFPCGSITGAPKVKAMEIIRSLEKEPRGVYTGAVGYAAPNGNIRFNVAIRTITLRDNKGEMGIGSGIVYDSDAGAEWDECHLKADFLTKPRPPFQLLETLLWQRDRGFTLLDRHLQRLAFSAAYFCYPCDLDTVKQALLHSVEGHDEDSMRIRLLMDQDGALEIVATPHAPVGDAAPWRFVISDQTINTDNPFLYHKTTNRAFYDDERTHQHSLTGCDEVLFVNQRGELSEGSITNVFLERDGQLLTPALSCGLLDGTLRRELIETGRACEAVLTPADLKKAERIWLGNSVRGLLHATQM